MQIRIPVSLSDVHAGNIHTFKFVTLQLIKLSVMSRKQAFPLKV